MRTIRWLLTIPAALLGWFAGFLAGLVIYKINVWSCPTKHILFGTCLAPWSPYIEKFGEALGVTTASSLIVLLPTLVAPTNRNVVAIASYLVSLVAVAYFVSHNIPDFWPRAVLTALAGGITLWRIKSAPIPPFRRTLR